MSKIVVPILGRILEKNAKGLRSVGKPVTLDVKELISSRLLLQADSGSGKSWALRRILEQTYGKILQWVIDPEGEFGSLREKGDYIIVGGENGDIPASIEHAPALARHLLELKVNVVFDLYEMPTVNDAKTRSRITRGEILDPTRSGYVAALINALMALPKSLWQPLLVVIDECQDFAPEEGKDLPSLTAIADLTARGRKRGFCGLYATNRIARIANNAIAGFKNYLIGSAALDADTKRAAKHLGFDRDGAMELAKDMRPGEFFGFGPAISRVVTRLLIGTVETSHPKPGEPTPVTPAPPEKVKKILSALKDLPKRVKQEKQDVESLKQKIAELERELEMARKTVTRQIEVEEEFVFRKGEVKILEKAGTIAASAAKWAAEVEKKTAVITTELAKLNENLARILSNANSMVDGTPQVAAEPQLRKATPITPATRVPDLQMKPAAPASIPTGDGSLSPKAFSILVRLYQFEGLFPVMERGWLACLTGYTNPRTPGFTNQLSALRTGEFLDYAAGGGVSLTGAGRHKASREPKLSMPLSTTDLIALLETTALDPKDGVILRQMLAFRKDGIPTVMRDQLCVRCGYTNPRTPGFTNKLSRLRTLGFIDYAAGGGLFLTNFMLLNSQP